MNCAVNRHNAWLVRCISDPTRSAQPWQQWERARRVLLGVVVFVLLQLPWPGVDRAFSRGFSAALNLVGLDTVLAPGLALRTEVAAPGELGAAHLNEGWYVISRVKSLRTQATTRMAFNTRATVYQPLVALLATCIILGVLDTRRGRWGFAAGLAVLFGAAMGAFALTLLRFLAQPRVRGVQLGDAALRAIDTVLVGWVLPPGMTYAVPILLGALLSALAGAGPPPRDSPEISANP